MHGCWSRHALAYPNTNNSGAKLFKFINLRDHIYTFRPAALIQSFSYRPKLL
jgi:hypothetical protein